MRRYDTAANGSAPHSNINGSSGGTVGGPVLILAKELPLENIPSFHNHSNGISTIDKPKSKLDEVEEEEPLLYGLLDVPPWYISIFLGFQVTPKKYNFFIYPGIF